MNTNNKKLILLKRIRVLVGIVLTIIGVSCILLGYSEISNQFANELLTSVGVETGVAGLILLFLEYFLFQHNDELAEELKYYRELFKANGILSDNIFTTKIPDLCNLYSEFHTYHYTRRDNTEVWMYNPITLIKDDVRMSLTGERRTINKHNVPNQFVLQAGLKDNTLIIFSKKETYGSEETVIDIIRDFSNANNQLYCGFRFHATWDKNYSVSPVLLTVDPFLKGQRKKPFVLNDTQKNEVENEWKKIATIQKINPLILKIYEK